MSFPSKTDVFIVGAGPAGSTLAYCLAQAGMDVVLIDKAAFPRAKTCGGGVNFRAVRLLPFDLSPLAEETIHQIAFTRNFGDLYMRQSPKPLLITVQRKNFDLFLVEEAKKAGAHFADQTRFLSSQEKSESIEVVTNRGACTAQYLVGADGIQSFVAKNLSQTQKCSHILVYHSEVPTFIFPSQEPGTIQVDWGSHKRAYAYLFPRKQTLAIGAGGVGNNSTGLRKYYQAFVQNKWQKEGPFSFSSAVFRLPLRERGNPVQKGRCLLVGDAASLLDPFTGEGIYYAIRSAQMAASALKEKRTVGKNPLQTYQEAVDRELMAEIEWSKLLRELFNLRPAYFHRKIASSDRWWNAMVKIIRGERTTVDVKRRLGLFGRILHFLIK